MLPAKGWRTLAVNGALAVGTAALSWGAGVNWVDYVGPVPAMFIVAALNSIMRVITTGPVGTKL